MTAMNRDEMMGWSLCVIAAWSLVVGAALCDRKPAESDFYTAAAVSSLGGVLRGPRVDPACSETVSVYSMGSATPSWTRLACPFARPGLVPWEDMFDALEPEEDVVLRSGDNVLVSCSPAVIVRRLTIEGGASLVFNDRNITFRVREIRILAGGSLWAGAETCRLYSRVDIVFPGDAVMSKPPAAPSKGVLCGGRLELHGKQYHPTWTRLAQSALAGSTVLVLMEPANWEPGQEILVTTTAPYDCPARYAAHCAHQPHQNEVRTIVAVHWPSRRVQISAPLQYTHEASPAFQGEVALLSRRVRLQGEDSGDGFGGHCMIWGKGVGRFSGVEGRNMGQLNVLGRYPFHLHTLGESRESFIQDCSVVRSNFRAFVIHGTNGTRCLRNVAYDVQGSAVLLEDGVEENNRIEHNLVAHVHPVLRPATADDDYQEERFDLVMPADIAAPAFLISNAHNIFIGNAASGGWSGFAFVNYREPMGLSRGDDFGAGNPWHRPALEFRGNTAHSSGFYAPRYGACVYQGGWLHYNASNNFLAFSSGLQQRLTLHAANGTAASMDWHDTKTWRCPRGGLTYWGNQLVVRGLEVHEARTGATLLGDAVLVQNALVHAAAPVGATEGRVALALGDAAASLDAVTLRGFEGTSDALLVGARALQLTDVAVQNTAAAVASALPPRPQGRRGARRRACALPCDLDQDGLVNASDLALFTRLLWGAGCAGTAPCCQLDCNADGVLDVIDAQCLIDAFIETTTD